jgi:hypothetical protein
MSHPPHRYTSHADKVPGDTNVDPQNLRHIARPGN